MVASTVPVTTCRTNVASVALPKTYHHPVRGGTGCCITGKRFFEIPRRSSMASHARLRKCIMSNQGHGSRLNLYVSVGDANGIAHQGTRRRSGDDVAAGVVDSAVAWAEEKFGVLFPAHRASEVCAIDRKCHQVSFAFAAQPRGRFGEEAVPGQGI